MNKKLGNNKKMRGRRDDSIYNKPRCHININPHERCEEGEDIEGKEEILTKFISCSG